MKGTHCNRFTQQLILRADQGLAIARHAAKLLRTDRLVINNHRADSLGGCVAEALTNRARLAG